jgi:hypothetical protein
MKTILAAAAIAVVPFSLAAQSTGPFQVMLSAFNPGRAPVQILSAWGARSGLSDGGPSKHPLVLQISELVQFPPGASAIAAVAPIDGLHVTHLGFDHQLGTYCTNGSPLQTISRLQVVQDEAGSTTLDNLDVNWSQLSGPGSAR